MKLFRLVNTLFLNVRSNSLLFANKDSMSFEISTITDCEEAFKRFVKSSLINYSFIKLHLLRILTSFIFCMTGSKAFLIAISLIFSYSPAATSFAFINIFPLITPHISILIFSIVSFNFSMYSSSFPSSASDYPSCDEAVFDRFSSESF